VAQIPTGEGAFSLSHVKRGFGGTDTKAAGKWLLPLATVLNRMLPYKDAKIVLIGGRVFAKTT
jgi:hypothetical protein